MGAGEQALDSTTAEDARDQAQVLRTALDLYPATLTLDELLPAARGRLLGAFRRRT